MPLLTGKLDPARYNATTLAAAWYDACRRGAPTFSAHRFEDIQESLRQDLVDIAQCAIDDLVEQGVIA